MTHRFLTIRRYLTVSALGNLLWESTQLPLYTIWQNGSPGEIAFAVAHCTVGDVLISASTLLCAVVSVGRGVWLSRYECVALLAICFAVLYTVFSEWFNVHVIGSWSYSPAMPRLPLLDIGFAPLLQWVIVPAAAFWYARPHES